MISKAHIKVVRSLHLQKFRQIYNKFIVEGGKVCTEFIKKNKFKIEEIYLTEEGYNKYGAILEKTRHTYELISTKEMDQLSALKTSADMLMVVQKAEDTHKLLASSDMSVIYLDDVQDPGNVGTIIRIADWFGIDAVVRSPNSADFFNPKVVQSTMGSMVNIHLITALLSDLIPYKMPVTGAFMDGVSIHEFAIPSNSILIMGNEGNGISQDNIQHIQHKISIPGAATKQAESLNVSVATGIICSLWKR